MLKRLNIYFKEMYPIIPRLILGFLVFSEMYFILILNGGGTAELHNGFNIVFQTSSMLEDGTLIDGARVFDIGIQEIICGFTVFSFLCWLRIADDFKDYELDCRLFAHRPLPSGRVTKKDLKIFITILITFTLLINLVFMPNFLFCLILYTYGSLMAVWFFQKHKIQTSLPKALVTHNPVQLILNLYIISFTLIKYKGFIQLNALYIGCALLTLYFPAFIWEISRKLRAPKDETEYVTYSKLFGVNKPTTMIEIVTIVDIITNMILVWQLNKLAVIALGINTAWMTWKFEQFKKNPEQFKIVDKVERYTYIQESMMIITIVLYLIIGKI